MNDRPHGNEPERDDVEILVRLAGKRAPVPAGRAERVRDAARLAWRAEVARRARRRWTWAAVAAAAAILAVAFVTPWRSDGTAPVEPVVIAAPPATVESIVGEVRIPGATGRGDAIAWGTEIETTAQGLVSVRLPSGHAVRVGSSTAARLSDPLVIELRRGTVYVDSGEGGDGGSPVSIRTPLGEITEVGTRFEVRVEGDVLRVRLRNGHVLVRAAGRIEQIDAGSEFVLGANGTVTRRGLAPDAPEWQWLLAVTPVPDFDGRPAAELLAWAAREQGWTVAYTDPATERAASATILRGSFEALQVQDALDAATLASRLTYRVEDGVLVVGTP
jgi:ferric-dicitrate binding protein FerR (iron transport regulator)